MGEFFFPEPHVGWFLVSPPLRGPHGKVFSLCVSSHAERIASSDDLDRSCFQLVTNKPTRQRNIVMFSITWRALHAHGVCSPRDDMLLIVLPTVGCQETLKDV